MPRERAQLMSSELSAVTNHRPAHARRPMGSATHRMATASSGVSNRAPSSASSARSVGTGASVDPRPLEGGAFEGSLTLWVDKLQDGLPILKYTPEFLPIFGLVLFSTTASVSGS